MSALAAVQQQFVGWLRDSDEGVAAAVSPQAQRGLPVYHYAYRASLRACLRETFTQTQAWLGDDQFDAAADAHIAARPSTSWTLSSYGDGFADTLASLYPDDAEVPELAVLEWAMRRAYDGPDGTPLSPEVLAQIDWDADPLAVVPTFVQWPVRTNADEIWQALAAGEGDIPAPQWLAEPCVIGVWRQGFDPRFARFDREDSRALMRLAAGASFGTICAELAAQADDAEAAVAQAASMLQRWIAYGLLDGATGSRGG